MKRTVILILVVAAVAFTAWKVEQWRSLPPEVPFSSVTRGTITSSVPTNGKVEPVQWTVARAEKPGLVAHILISKGQRVNANDPLVELDSADAQAEKVAAESRISQARADLDLINRGGRPAEITEIEGSLDRTKLELQIAQREHDSLVRLQAKQAVTLYEVTSSASRLEQLRQQIKSLEQKKISLAALPSDRTAAEARLRDAEAALRLAEIRIRMSTVRAPMAGIVYQFDLKPGAYLNAGDAVASIGRLDQVVVTVYVDEPDLGRVEKGMPVFVTWDALPDRKWQGTVDRKPTQIVALGSRQVGEVVCLIQNHDLTLLNGTNVNAEIRTNTVENALTMSKEAIRREGNQPGVLLLDKSGETSKVVWRKITLGVNNTTRTQVEGLKEGDSVALPTERPLKDGMLVRPVFP